LRDFLSKRYKKDLAAHIVKILEIHSAQNSNMNIDETEYYSRLEKIFQQK
jgi:hypothetical protein